MRTKIIATLGPASANYETMKAMAEKGACIFRLNFSHSDAAAFVPVVAIIRKLEKDLGIPLTIMGDLCGPKTRIGEVEGSPRQIEKGSIVSLGLPDQRDKAEGVFISLDFPELLVGLDAGMPVSLSDGMLQFTVERVVKDNRLFTMRAENGGLLTSNKGIAFPGKFHPMPAMTAKDRKDLHEGMDIGLDAVALSFVQTAQDIADIKAEIDKHGRWIPVVAKLERQNAVENLDAILDIADAVMVARGDLGLECPMASVPVIQKRIIRAARHAQKACIVATQMLLSMVKNPIPTRAETTDVANAILDGADCVMLSEETAIGAYPAQAVAFMNDIAKETETYLLERIEGPFLPKRESNMDKYMAYCASLLADNSDSKAIVCHTVSGSTARMLASRRPIRPVYALAEQVDVVKYLNFFWGVRPYLSESAMPRHMNRVQKFVQDSKDFAEGDCLVLTSGQPTPGQKTHHTNQIRVFYK
ncbi:MAG: pyruvate kinase [Desulfovibrionaceae bacterium]